MTTHEQQVGYSVDWERVAETGVTTGLSLIPEVGEVLSVFVEAFWPADKEDVWGEIKDEVEQLVEEKISEDVWKRNAQGLKGLRANFDNYLVHLKDGKDVNEISQDWHAANSQFEQWVPQFQEPGFEVLLLPLFAQVANLHLALLRDGVLFGAKWGMQPDTIKSYAKQQTSLIGSYSRYAERIYLNGYLNALGRGGLDYKSCQPFATTNAYRRGMIFAAMDFARRWQYFDATQYPHGAPPEQLGLMREIYSDPFGTAEQSGLIIPSWRPPTQPPNQITVWGDSSFIKAAQVTYPPGAGPDGRDATPRMGSQSQGSSSPPGGGVVNLAPTNPIIGANVNHGDCVDGFSFTFKDGSTGQQFGGPGGAQRLSVRYPGHVLSSIWISGTRSALGWSADCVVFGFQPEPRVATDLEALRLPYVTSPAEPDLPNLLTRAHLDASLLPELEERASAEQWDNQRTAYWESKQPTSS